MAGAAEVLDSIVLVLGGFVDRSGWEQVYNMMKNDGYAVSVVQKQRRRWPMTLRPPSGSSPYHLPFPGFGHVVREGSAYRWLPADWRWTS
jgi:hypothetical protein